jgi:hypothetical protein
MSNSQRFLCLAALICSVILREEAGAQFVQQGGKLVGTGAAGSANQGRSVSLSADGNTAIVGGDSDSSLFGVGAAWVFVRTGGEWHQRGSKLVGTGYSGGAHQGRSVSLSAHGNTAIVGGPVDDGSTGAAWVFAKTNDVWTQQGAKLVGSGARSWTYMGTSVSLSADGNTAIVGGDGDSGNVGAAWVFTRQNDVWSQQGPKLVGTGAVGDAYQGVSVSVSGDGSTAIVGGKGDSGFAGAAWVFIRKDGQWSQQGPKLVGSGAVGKAYQGCSVSLSAKGDTALVGGALDSLSGSNATGAAWVFVRTDGVWKQEGGKLVGTGGATGSMQGFSVSLSSDGKTAVVGGVSDSFSTSAAVGAAWVWTREGNGVWNQQGSKLVGTGATGYANQGWSVAISADGETAIVGGPEDGGGLGAVWMFTLSGVDVNQAERPFATAFSLHQNYPNPFNPSTMIRYALPLRSHVTLAVYNLLGQLVALLVDDEVEAGVHEVKCDASAFASGVYFYRLQAGGYVETRKLCFAK